MALEQITINIRQFKTLLAVRSSFMAKLLNYCLILLHFHKTIINEKLHRLTKLIKMKRSVLRLISSSLVAVCHWV
jgi:hypothetical protein